MGESGRKYSSVLDMSEAIARGDGGDDVVSNFRDSCLTDDHLVHWRHPDLDVNIFQFTILHRRPDIVQSLGNMCPYFLTDMSAYQSDRASIELNLTDEVRIHVLLNHPLHLACMVGCIESIKFLLENKCNFYLKKNAFINVCETKTEHLPMKWMPLPWSEVKDGTPFELCVAGGHIDCVFHLMKAIDQCLALKFLYAGIQESSLMLHMACSIGCGPLVKLLLEKNSSLDVPSTSDGIGKSPLHVAVWNGDTETIRNLLECGALVNATTESKGCFHILYRSKIKPFNYVANTRLLIQYGIDVHMKDKNGVSALHVLAEEIGFSRIDAMRYWKKAAQGIFVMTSSTDTEHEDYQMETYQNDLVNCLGLLLHQGTIASKTSTLTSDLEAVIELLLHSNYLSKSQTILWNCPKLVYRAVELLLSHDANPNKPIHSPDTSLFTYFVLHHLNDIEDEVMKCKFVHLFGLYGVDMDGLSSNTQCSPLVLAVKKRTHLNVVELIVNTMSTEHYIHAMLDIQQTIIPSFMDSDDPRVVKYAVAIVQLFEQLGLRSLKHMSKICILKQLRRPVTEVQDLPLPTYVKNYVISVVF